VESLSGIINYNNKITTLVANIIYPPTCVLCYGQSKTAIDLCAECYVDLPHRQNLHCQRPNSLKEVNRCIAPLNYNSTAAYLIKGLKYHNRLAYGRILSHILAECVTKEVTWMQSNTNTQAIPIPQCIIPVPLHSSKIKERGFNQTQEIARIAAKMLHLPIENKSCVRILATKPQARLTYTQRLRNVSGAFAVIGSLPKCVALVDDVITTGATINELATTLKKAGVQYIHAWIVTQAGD
jgi:ComF family protein